MTNRSHLTIRRLAVFLLLVGATFQATGNVARCAGIFDMVEDLIDPPDNVNDALNGGQVASGVLDIIGGALGGGSNSGFGGNWFSRQPKYRNKREAIWRDRPDLVGYSGGPVRIVNDQYQELVGYRNVRVQDGYTTGINVGAIIGDSIDAASSFAEQPMQEFRSQGPAIDFPALPQNREELFGHFPESVNELPKPDLEVPTSIADARAFLPKEVNELSEPNLEVPTSLDDVRKVLSAYSSKEVSDLLKPKLEMPTSGELARKIGVPSSMEELKNRLPKSLTSVKELEGRSPRSLRSMKEMKGRFPTNEEWEQIGTNVGKALTGQGMGKPRLDCDGRGGGRQPNSPHKRRTEVEVQTGEADAQAHGDENGVFDELGQLEGVINQLDQSIAFCEDWSAELSEIAGDDVIDILVAAAIGAMGRDPLNDGGPSATQDLAKEIVQQEVREAFEKADRKQYVNERIEEMKAQLLKYEQRKRDLILELNKRENPGVFKE